MTRREELLTRLLENEQEIENVDDAFHRARQRKADLFDVRAAIQQELADLTSAESERLKLSLAFQGAGIFRG